MTARFFNLILGFGAALSFCFSAETAEDFEHFEKEIRPLLIKHCYDCHSTAENKAKGGLTLDFKSGWQVGGDSGPALVPGSPEESLLLEAISYKNHDMQMPPKTRLTSREVASFKKWIAEGAPDPRGGGKKPKAEPISGMSLSEGKEFRSFRPLDASEGPDNSDIHPIDHFIHAKLREKGLKPAPGAPRETLIRRAYLDLLGLPPTPEEIDRFLENHYNDAFETLVDRLLESDQYGVRWGRHWLDVARYADSNGLDENLAFGQAWRFRDYVIESFNEDKPFDRFVIEQLAGDLVSNPTHETLTGTGFLALGARVLAEPDRAKLEMDVIDEQIDTMGKAFLGLTLGCARCHDHKFDPITQADYYSLAAIFKSTESFAESNTGAIKHWFEHSIGTEEEIARAKEVDKEIKKLKGAASSFKSKEIVRLRGEARSKATDYLAASVDLPFGATLSTARKLAEPLSLHPRILLHCRTHLEYHKNDPVFSTWHQFSVLGDKESIRTFYREKFKAAEAAYAKHKKENPKAKEIPDPELNLYYKALFDHSGFLAVPAKPSHAFDKETYAEYQNLNRKAIAFESGAFDAPAVMGVADSKEPVAELAIHIRGSHNNLGEPVPKTMPAVFGESSTIGADRSGRLELAHWMTSLDSALAAKVYVNRIWRWHFGKGLVKTTDNFGVLGSEPTHPELLDWLTDWFIKNGWSTKALHRLIMSSDVYQMSSLHPDHEKLRELDPENALLASFPARRLEAEAIRDSILSMTRELELSIGGKTIPLRNRQFVFNHTSEDRTQYRSLRRSAFLPVVRNHLCALFEQFDYPDPAMVTGDRSVTTVAPQALYLMNSDLVLDTAESFAKQLMEIENRNDAIVLAYRRTLGRKPDDRELDLVIQFLELGNHRDDFGGWTQFCQNLMMSNEFVFLD